MSYALWTMAELRIKKPAHELTTRFGALIEMKPKWHFKPFLPGDRARNSQVEKFFRSDAIEDSCDAVVREGIQNSLDAARETDLADPVSIKVRMTLGEVSPERVRRFFPGLFDHLDALRDKLPDIPDPGEPIRFLAFEDFNTTGLCGDPEQWEPVDSRNNAFFNFFRGEGVSDKSEHQRGRHGVGKMVFSVASRARCIFGLTCTDQASPLLMGTATLIQHRCSHKPFHPDGWFGLPRQVESSELIIPVTDGQLVGDFSDAFGLERQTLAGLSIVVPWVNAAFSHRALVQAVVKGYFWPILQKKLFVEVKSREGGETDINSRTLAEVVSQLVDESSDEKLRADMKETLDLAAWANGLSPQQILAATAPSGNAQEWSTSLLPELARNSIRSDFEWGRSVALRMPMRIRRKGHQPEITDLCVYIKPDQASSDGRVFFIREGLLITGVKNRRCPGFRALVVIEEGPLGSFLGDAENPSHTEWQKENVRDKYLYHDSCIRFVVQSVPNLLKTLSDSHRQSDPTLLLDLFSLPSTEQQDPITKQKRPKAKGPGTPDPQVPKIPRTPKRFSLEQRDSGFVVKRGDADAPVPQSIDLEVAYGVRKGSPFRKYRDGDFELQKKPIDVHVSGGSILICEGNHLRVAIESSDFEIRVAGFDTNRDLHVNPRIDSGKSENEDGEAV